MRIAIGADHVGKPLKDLLIAWLWRQGHTPIDVGTESEVRCNYPEFAAKLAHVVKDANAATISDDPDACVWGILVCGSGLGMAIAANRFAHLRAVPCTLPLQAEYARLHNDANVLCLGSRFLSTDDAIGLTEIFLATPFEGGRHQIRIEQLKKLR